MMRPSALAASVVIATTSMSHADTTELMFCAMENSSKMVSVRLDGADVTYAYGNLNEMSDLVLTTPAADVDYQPWPGVGNTIWETITFYNGDYEYVVVMGAERQDNPQKYGGITVRKAGEEIAALDCIPSSVSFDFGNHLYDAKTEAGWCLDRGAKGGWTRCD
ncbi:MAG: hypothetical protein ABJO29_08105 [Yoonia sp.]|uniref:hypothetical protein n=1 Tax=Yoonia sp. TaxID=2212373 RepID=UPI00326563AB